MPVTHRLLVFLLLITAAGVLRFYHLGKWSFAGDELYTIMETESLFGEADIPEAYRQTKAGPVPQEETQYYRLPRMVFMAHAVHWLDYKLFGKDEFGSRVLMAAIGSVTVGAVFLLALPLLGFPGAMFLSLLILLWPEHLMQSQTNRFYPQAVFFVCTVFLLGGYVAARRSTAAAFWLGPCSVLMVLNHSLGGLIWAILLVGLVADLVFTQRDDGRSIPWKLVGILAAWSVVLLLIAWFHILPMFAGWNSAAAAWGYTPKYSVMTFAVIYLGWPTSLVAGAGFLYAFADLRRPGNAYWLTAALCCGLCVVALPMKIVYNPLYHLLFSLPFFFVASLLVAKLFTLLGESDLPLRKTLGWTMIGLCTFANVPAVVSHYKDGSRDDYRSAFHYIRDHWQPGDAWAGPYMQFADHYIPELEPKIRLPWFCMPEKLREVVESRKDEKGRLWIMICYNRDGMDPEFRRAVTEHAVFQREFRVRRYDFSDYTIELYLFTPEESRP